MPPADDRSGCPKRRPEALALTRPGHPADEQSTQWQPPFAETAAIIAEAIADAWQRLGEERPCIALLGHSIGGATAVHIAAAQTLTWPLLGLTVSGVGDVIAPGVCGSSRI
ncbi:alpha/beta fold hydrolase [Streptomyces coriariae]|uniref:alpha/beta fold hydrolase n=1 Tax=Streptomyces coriariae TaxID=2864460 RepID=UPI001E4B42BA|nr:alpha/beta fold hydrolase [Streptomyces coriariae]